MSTTTQQILSALWRERMHVEPNALQLSPPAVRTSYAHIWQPAELLVCELEHFPLGFLCIWHECPRGHVVLTHLPSRYAPGPQPWREAALESVCYISVVELRQDRRTAIAPLLHLFDHLLGSAALAEGPWLSDGAGINPTLREVGQRFAGIYALGYGQSEFGAYTPHDYFAHTVWCYLHDPQRLNVVDPLLFKLYHHALMRKDLEIP